MLFAVCLTGIAAKAQIQEDPAHWAYAMKKVSGDNYEVHLRCKIDTGWHIYAQRQTAEFIGTRTKVEFGKQVGVIFSGLPVEHGKKEVYRNKEVGITNYEYAGVVDFVQRAEIKPGVKSVSANITYQTCTHQRCLTEKTISVTIPVP